MTDTAERIHRALARIESLILETHALRARRDTAAAELEALRLHIRDEITEHASADDVFVEMAAYIVLILAQRDLAQEAHQ